MTEFAKEDVLTLAKAILEDCVMFRETCDYRGEYNCEYCNSRSYELEDFNHELTCPVLVAKDVMTGNE